MIWARRILITVSVVVDVVDGVAGSRAVGLQSDRISVASIGSIDLGTEAMDLSFRVKQREGIGVSVAGLVNPDGS